MAVFLAPLLVTFGMGIISGATNVLAEAIIDTTTDFVIDKAGEAFEKCIPSLSDNQYMKQFTNQARMGMASATNARVMSKSMQSQNKIEEKILEKKEAIEKRYKEKHEKIKSMKAKGLAGKRMKSLKEQYHKEISQVEEDGKRIYQMRQSASTEAMGLNGGTGMLKQGHDGTIQNMKPDGTFELSRTIKDLLMSQNFYTDKTGVRAI